MLLDCAHPWLAARCRALVNVAARLAFAALIAAASPAGWAQVASPHAIDIPPWFAKTFLDFRDDVRDAAGEGKRLLVYFGQDGCPYCKELMQTNFSQRDIVELTRKSFVSLEINIWGDREVTWLDGRTMREKDFARMLNVQFTPTVLFFDERGKVIARVNGYFPPHRFRAVLEYVAGRMENKMPWPLISSRSRRTRPALSCATSRSSSSHHSTFALAPGAARSPFCSRLGTARRAMNCIATRSLRPKFAHNWHGSTWRASHSRIGPRSSHLTGRRLPLKPGRARSRSSTHRRSCSLKSAGRRFSVPSRTLAPFHLASAIDYVASGAYRKEPSFQRFVSGTCRAIARQGQTVDLWK